MSERRKAYGFLTAPDNAGFCQRMTDVLHDSGVSCGSPLMQVDSDGNRYCGQAVVLPEFLSTYSKN